LLVVVGGPAAFAEPAGSRRSLGEGSSASLDASRGRDGEPRPENPQSKSGSAVQTDISGIWNASFDTQIGKQDYTYQFQVKDEKLTGKASSPIGESDIQNGKVEGAKVTFVENLHYQGMTIVITYSGTVVSADEIRFMRQVGEFDTEELVARRIRP
jgi:hypothetical protein